jgi:hypothetical protein
LLGVGRLRLFVRNQGPARAHSEWGDTLFSKSDGGRGGGGR